MIRSPLNRYAPTNADDETKGDCKKTSSDQQGGYRTNYWNSDKLFTEQKRLTIRYHRASGLVLLPEVLSPLP
jgi:hypothetical protein